MNKLISALFLLNAFAAQAKGPIDTHLPGAESLQSATSPSIKNLVLPRYGSSGDGRDVYFYIEVTLGYASMKATGPVAFNKGGLAASGELGIKINVPARRSNAQNLLSIGVGGFNTDIRMYDFRSFIFPVTYSHMGFINGGDNLGFYAQIGIVPNYVYHVTNQDRADVIKHFNSFFVEPMVSAGFHCRFILLERWTRNMGEGRLFVGPYFSYGIGNLSKAAGETITPGYKIGLRWAYLL